MHITFSTVINVLSFSLHKYTVLSGRQWDVLPRSVEILAVNKEPMCSYKPEFHRTSWVCALERSVWALKEVWILCPTWGDTRLCRTSADRNSETAWLHRDFSSDGRQAEQGANVRKVETYHSGCCVWLHDFTSVNLVIF